MDEEVENENGDLTKKPLSPSPYKYDPNEDAFDECDDDDKEDKKELSASASSKSALYDAFYGTLNDKQTPMDIAGLFDRTQKAVLRYDSDTGVDRMAPEPMAYGEDQHQGHAEQEPARKESRTPYLGSYFDKRYVKRDLDDLMAYLLLWIDDKSIVDSINAMLYKFDVETQYSDETMDTLILTIAFTIDNLPIRNKFEQSYLFWKKFRKIY